MATIAAATQSTVRQNGGHQRVLFTKPVRCCHRSLAPCPTSPATATHGDPVTATAPTRTKTVVTLTSTAINLLASVCHGEADIDRGDQDEADGINGRWPDPPKAERGSGLEETEDHTPDEGDPQTRGSVGQRQRPCQPG